MNKKLLTLAIGAALASAPMFANAAATVYGAAHLSIDMLDDGNTTNNSLLTMASNSSFIGINAEEDLGGGMKALAGLEWQVALDSGTTGMANRNVFVGLQGGFGTVRLGNYDDIVKNVGRAVDFFYSEQIGESRSITAKNGGLDGRLANSVRYDSPKLGPVTLTAHYGMANNDDETTGLDLTAYAVGAQMDMGGLYVGLGYKSQEVQNLALNGKDSATGMRLSASYTIGAFKVGGLYQNYQNDAPAADQDQTVYGVGASFKVGNGLIKGQYYVADELTSNADNGATLTAIGYDHNLSKNTMVYATYASVDNDGAGAFSVIGAGHSNPNDTTGFSPVAADSNSAFSVGMKVKF